MRGMKEWTRLTSVRACVQDVQLFSVVKENKVGKKEADDGAATSSAVPPSPASS
jgi:hypothetical protein